MRLALWLAAAALPLAAQPKLLVNAKVDTRSAAAGLEREFKSLVAAEPQPAWILYSVPVLKGRSLGCELVSPNGWRAPGVVHLEPPGQMLVMFRVESKAVERVRTLSPDCEIDAGGLPAHWLTDVDPAQSVALLAGMAAAPHLRDRAVAAIGLHAEPSADDVLVAMASGDKDPHMRSQAISALGRRPGPKAVQAITAAISGDADSQVRRRAVSALQNLPDGQGVPLLIQVAKSSRDAAVRKQAMASLSQTKDPRAAAFFEEVLK